MVNLKKSLIFLFACSLSFIILNIAKADSSTIKEEDLGNLLPKETLGVISISDRDTATSTFLKTPFGKLWSHPQMAPLKKQIFTNLLSDSTLLSETNTIFNFFNKSSLTNIRSGYIAFIKNSAKDNFWLNTNFSILRALEAEPILGLEISNNFIDITNKLAELTHSSISPLKIETNNNIISIGIPIPEKYINKISDFLKESFEIKPHTLWITGFDDYLLFEINNTASTRLIINVKVENSPSLSEHSEWIKNKDRFTNTALWGWCFLSPIIDRWIDIKKKESEEFINKNGTESDMSPEATEEYTPANMPIIIDKLGLESFLSLSFCLYDTPVGIATDYIISSPKESRNGLAKLMDIENGDCTPPDFIDANLLSFSRTRLDIATSLDIIEKMIDEIMPDVRDLLVTSILPGILEKEPEFDFKKQFILPLQNDIITLTANESTYIRFLRIENAEKYIENLKKIIAVLAPFPILESKVGHYKITSIPLPNLDNVENKTNYCHFALKNNLVAFSSEKEKVNSFLSKESKVKTTKLIDLQGFTSAIQFLDAHSVGYMGYKNSKETAQSFYNELKAFASQEQKQSMQLPLFNAFSQNFSIALPFVKNIISPNTLPEFNSIADCFSYSISTFQAKDDMFIFRSIHPLSENDTSIPKQIKEEIEFSEIESANENDEIFEVTIPEPDPIAPLPPSDISIPDEILTQ